jgi:hypothetical protein
LSFLIERPGLAGIARWFCKPLLFIPTTIGLNPLPAQASLRRQVRWHVHLERPDPPPAPVSPPFRALIKQRRHPIDGPGDLRIPSNV